MSVYVFMCVCMYVKNNFRFLGSLTPHPFQRGLSVQSEEPSDIIIWHSTISSDAYHGFWVPGDPC